MLPGRRAVFWQSLAQCFILLQIDWEKQVPPAEQPLRHVHQQKQCSPISKSAPNFLPGRGWARAPVPAPTCWATVRWGQCRRAALAEMLGWDQGNLCCFPCLHYQAQQCHGGPFLTPSTLHLYICGRRSSRQTVPLIWVLPSKPVW